MPKDPELKLFIQVRNNFGDNCWGNLGDNLFGPLASQEIYLKKEYHLKSQSLKLYEGLPRFSNEDDINIFDFLKRFYAIAEEFDIPLEKAEYLYSHFLSPSIQEEVVRYKNDYNSLRSILLQRYGNLKTIIHKLLVPIFNSKIPEQQDPAFLQLSYYRKLHFVFNNIHELLTLQNEWKLIWKSIFSAFWKVSWKS